MSGDWVTVARYMEVRGGEEGVDWVYTPGRVQYHDAEYGTGNVVEVLTSTPLAFRSTSSNKVGIQVNPGVHADITLAGFTLKNVRIPFNIMTNKDDPANPTRCHITLADGTANTLWAYASYGSSYNGQNSVSAGFNGAGIRCGEGSYLVIDDERRNTTVPGGNVHDLDSMVAPVHGQIGTDATLEDGTRLSAGDPSTNLDSAEPGTLSVKAGFNAAAIGGTHCESSGHMTFNGGIITIEPPYAKDTNGSAGIGGGCLGSASYIAINSGTITARGAYHGAAIGGGWHTTSSAVPTASYRFPDNIRDLSDSSTLYETTPASTIFINGGYINAMGSTHGNAFGNGCGNNPNVKNILRVAGGTLIPDTSATDFDDLGFAGGHVIITGGSVFVNETGTDENGNPTYKFQGWGDTAWGSDAPLSYDYGEEALEDPNHPINDPDNPDKVFLVTVNVSAEIEKRNDLAGITSTDLSLPIVKWDCRIDGVPYPYGAPSYFHDGKLYLWVPKAALDDEIEVDISYRDANGDIQDLNSLFRRPGTDQGGDVLKGYVFLDVPEGMLTKYYDGTPLEGFAIGGNALTDEFDNVLHGTASDTYRYQRYAADKETRIGSPVATAAELGADALTAYLTAETLEYAELDGFKDSYWGHRVIGWAEIKPIGSKVTSTTASWVPADPDPNNQALADCDLKVQATISRGDADPEGNATAATCAAPEGRVQLYIDGAAAGDPVRLVFEGDLDENNAPVPAGDARINAVRVPNDSGGGDTALACTFPGAGAGLSQGAHDVAVRYLPPEAGDPAPANYLASADPADPASGAGGVSVPAPTADPAPTVAGEPDPGNTSPTAEVPELETDPVPAAEDPDRPGATHHRGKVTTTITAQGPANPYPGRVLVKVSTPSLGELKIDAQTGPFSADFLRDGDGEPVRDAGGAYTIVLDPSAAGTGTLKFSQGPSGAYTGTAWTYEVEVLSDARTVSVEVQPAAALADGCTAAASPTSVLKGGSSTVTWAGAPSAGWEATGVDVTPAGGATVSLSAADVAAGTYALADIAEDTVVTVRFARPSFALSAQASPSGGGTAWVGAPLSPTRPATGTCEWGQPAQFSWEPAPGYRLRELTANGAPVAGAPVGSATTGTWTAADVRAATALRAVFEPIPVGVAARLVTANGDAAPAAAGSAAVTPADVAWNGSATVSWTIDAAWQVDAVRVGGIALSAADLALAAPNGGSGSWTVANVTSQVTVEVEVSRRAYPASIEVSPAGAGVTASLDKASVWWGESVTATWAARTGWQVDAVTVERAGQAPRVLTAAEIAAGSLAVADVREAVKVTVAASQVTYPVTAAVAGGAGGAAAIADGAANPAASIVHGQPFTFSWAADDGWEVADIAANGESVTVSGLFPLADAGSWTCPSATRAWDFQVTYRKKTYPVTVACDPSDGSGGAAWVGAGPARPASALVEHGGSIPIAWEPAAGWHVASVTEGAAQLAGASAGPGSIALATVTAPRTVKVAFARDAHPLALTVSDPAGAAISASALGGATLAQGAPDWRAFHGDAARVSWSLQVGWEVVSVTVDGAERNDLLGAGGVDLGPVTGPRSVHVGVQRKTYPVELELATAGGSAVPGKAGDPAAVHGSSVEVAWAPDAGYRCTGAEVSLDGGATWQPVAVTDAGGSYTAAPVTGPVRVRASFERLKFTVTTWAGPNPDHGTVTGAGTYEWGSSPEVTWSAAAGAYVQSIEVDGAAYAKGTADGDAKIAAGAQPFPAIDANHNVSVSFLSEDGRPVVAVQTTGDGSAGVADGDSLAGALAFEAGETASVKFAPNAGHDVASATLAVTGPGGTTVETLSAADIAAAAGAGYPIPDLERDTAYLVTVVFEPWRYTVAGSVSAGNGTVPDSTEGVWQDVLQIPVTPDAGWQLAAASIDGTPLSGAEIAAARASGKIAVGPLAKDPGRTYALDVSFERIPCTAFITWESEGALTPSAGGWGSVDGLPEPATGAESSVRRHWGDPASFSWHPRTGWEAKAAALTDGAGTRPLPAPALAHEVGALASDTRVHVVFARMSVPVTCESGEPGAVAFDAPAALSWEEGGTVGWTLSEGWEATGVAVDGVPLSGADLAAAIAAGEATVAFDRQSQIDAGNVRVRVDVARKSFPVEAEMDLGAVPEDLRGAFSATGAGTVLWGESGTASWTLPEGWMAAEVWVDGARVAALEGPGAPTSWTFADIKGTHTVKVVPALAPKVFEVSVIMEDADGTVLSAATVPVSEGDSLAVVWAGEAPDQTKAHRAGIPEGYRLTSAEADDRALDPADGLWLLRDADDSHVVRLKLEKLPVPPAPGPDDPEPDPGPAGPAPAPGPSEPASGGAPAPAPATLPGPASDTADIWGEPTRILRLSQTGDGSATLPFTAMALGAAAALMLARVRRDAARGRDGGHD